MVILAHRGCWNGKIAKNSSEALRGALEKGYGFESDVRDYGGRMVISHNMADSSSLDAEKVFGWLHEFEDKHCFAINIKADGLKDILKSLLEKYSISSYFLFDMSVPQMVEFRDMGLRVFTRQSEVEPEPCMYRDSAGVWMDGFWRTDWITPELIQKHIDNGKEVCLVSPELHGRRNYKKFWAELRSNGIDLGRVILCTDYPDEAREYFNE